jgi:hypothetical protein
VPTRIENIYKQFKKWNKTLLTLKIL